MLGALGPSDHPDTPQALYASKIISYAQGFMLLRQAATEFGWTLNYGAIALMWRGGCIIRSAFLGKIKEAFDRNPGLQNLLLDDFFRAAVEQSQVRAIGGLWGHRGSCGTGWIVSGSSMDQGKDRIIRVPAGTR